MCAYLGIPSAPEKKEGPPMAMNTYRYILAILIYALITSPRIVQHAHLDRGTRIIIPYAFLLNLTCQKRLFFIFKRCRAIISCRVQVTQAKLTSRYIDLALPANASLNRVKVNDPPVQFFFVCFSPPLSHIIGYPSITMERTMSFKNGSCKTLSIIRILFYKD